MLKECRSTPPTFRTRRRAPNAYPGTRVAWSTITVLDYQRAALVPNVEYLDAEGVVRARCRVGILQNGAPLTVVAIRGLAYENLLHLRILLVFLYEMLSPVSRAYRSCFID